MEEERIELEDVGSEVVLPQDKRVRVEEPLPVRLVAVGDVKVLGKAGDEEALVRFYVGMWGFERDEGFAGVAFWAENFRVVFEMREGLVEREDMRPMGVEVKSLVEAEKKLIEAEMEYQWQRGLQAGCESIFLQDPAGNWVELVESR